MSLLLAHLWNLCKRYYKLDITWVRGHSKDFGNEKADALAGKGGDYLLRAGWWKRPYILGDWEQEVFRRTCHAAISLGSQIKVQPPYRKQTIDVVGGEDDDLSGGTSGETTWDQFRGYVKQAMWSCSTRTGPTSSTRPPASSTGCVKMMATTCWTYGFPLSLP